MKEDNGNQDVGRTEFDYPNNQCPKNYNQIFYGNQSVPEATNNAAKIVNADKIMRQALRGK